MNNETNNTVNNNENPSGINFIQGGTPIGNTPNNNLPPQQPVYQAPVQAPVMGTPEVSQVEQTNTPPVTSQPVEQSPINFVTSNNSGTVVPQPMPSPQTINQTPSAMVSPMPNTTMVPPTMPNQPPMGPMPGEIPPMTNNHNPSDSEGNEKQKTPIVMIIITIIVVLGVAVFLILYLTGKINFGSSNNNNDENNGQTITDEPNNDIAIADWMTYILNQNPNEIKINRYIDADNSKVINLTKEQLEDIFTKINEYNLIKYYSSTRTIANDELQITYVKDGETYNFTLSDKIITIGDDNSLKELFENSNATVEDDGQTSRDSEDYNYILKEFENSTYDEYFTSSEEENNNG